jgi:hypothetical protein
VLATFDANTTYAVKHPVQRPSPAGVPEDAMRTTHFEVTAIVRARARPTLMPTVLLPDLCMMREPVALQVRFLDVWGHEAIGGQLEPGARLVYPESDPEWVTPSRITPFQFLREQLTRFTWALPSEEVGGCLVLREPHAGGPRWPLHDERCPTLTLQWNLTSNLGWDLVTSRVTHTLATVGSLDSRGGPSNKWYYRLLMQSLAACLPLSSGHIPSAEPLLYHRCLLDGVAVEPGLGNPHYLAIANSGRTKKNKPLLALEPGPVEPTPPPPPLADGPFCFCRFLPSSVGTTQRPRTRWPRW